MKMKIVKMVAVLVALPIISTGCGKENIESRLKAGKNDISFQSQGYKLAAHLYVPGNYNSSEKYPTVIFSGPFNQVKEQTGAVYGKKLAAKGYNVLVFDHVGYGDSEGEVRNNEHSYAKMESIRDGISFLRTLKIVDKSKVYGLGICASGGYIPIVAVTDKRLAAISTVSGMMDNYASYFKTMTREQLIPLFKMANEARQKQYETGKVEYYDILGMEKIDPSKLSDGNAMKEGYDYYMTKRAGAQTYPNYSHLAPKTIMENAPITSAASLAPYLYTPYLGIYGTAAMQDTAPLTIEFYKRASEPKELFEIKGASHVSLYDIDRDVDQAVNRIDTFFKKYSI